MRLKQLILIGALTLAGVLTVSTQNYRLNRSFTSDEQERLDSITKTFSKAEMKEDIDFLYRVINEVNPQIKVLSSVMGEDFRSEMKRLKLRADSIETFDEYYKIASKMLRLCNESHCEFTEYYVKDIDNGNVNPYITKDGLTLTEYCMLKYWERISYIGMEYIDGKYYFPYTKYSITSRNCLSKRCGEEYFPVGSQVVEVDSIPIDEYISKYYAPSLAWCFDYNKKIARSLVEPYCYGLNDSIRGPFDIKYKYQGKTDVTTMNRPNTRTFIVRNGIFSQSSNVYWFGKTKTLYIRIPQMDYNLLAKYQKKISKYKNKEINKVIIDIRGNGGGNDMLWEGVLSSIIKNPISYDMLLYSNNMTLVRDYITNIRKEKLENYKIIHSPHFLYSDSALVIDKKDEIYPSVNSLAYDGKIYVLYNEDCYSSSLAFIKVCNLSEQLVSAGVPTNNIVGRSSTPFYFSLPNTKLVFRMIPCLDVSGVKTNKDLFDHSPELPITLTIEDYAREISYTKDRYGKKYLLNHDNAIKRILELE